MMNENQRDILLEAVAIHMERCYYPDCSEVDTERYNNVVRLLGDYKLFATPPKKKFTVEDISLKWESKSGAWFVACGDYQWCDNGWHINAGSGYGMKTACAIRDGLVLRGILPKSE